MKFEFYVVLHFNLRSNHCTRLDNNVNVKCLIIQRVRTFACVIFFYFHIVFASVFSCLSCTKHLFQHRFFINLGPNRRQEKNKHSFIA